MHQQLDLFSTPDRSHQPTTQTQQVTVIHPKSKGPEVHEEKEQDTPQPVKEEEETITPHASDRKKRGRKSLKELGDDPHVIKDLDNMTLDKQYYSISEVAAMFRVNTSLIRYWENEFDILQPKKNRKGDRLFRQEDIHHLKLIYHLLRERKYTIEGAKQKLKEDRKLAARNFEMVQALLKVRGFLTELKDQL
ncbi:MULTISPECIES: MerR family transcriptional regulator [Chitinophaga]|uniref:MerR family transcriptional regulator n=1 Tax=Chitinophaga TaxID=79328 RepID=UPI001CEC87A5|nr:MULTISPECIES: MerR family transcriptional regulator [Chitinophaga]